VAREADQDPPGLCHAHRRRYAPAVIPASAIAVKTLNKAVILARPMIGKRERIEAWQDFKKRESTQGSGVAHHSAPLVFVSIFSRLSPAPFRLSVLAPQPIDIARLFSLFGGFILNGAIPLPVVERCRHFARHLFVAGDAVIGASMGGVDLQSLISYLMRKTG
jgi:hypothetical protein